MLVTCYFGARLHFMQFAYRSALGERSSNNLYTHQRYAEKAARIGQTYIWHAEECVSATQVLFASTAPQYHKLSYEDAQTKCCIWSDAIRHIRWILVATSL